MYETLHYYEMQRPCPKEWGKLNLLFIRFSDFKALFYIALFFRTTQSHIVLLKTFQA